MSNILKHILVGCKLKKTEKPLKILNFSRISATDYEVEHNGSKGTLHFRSIDNPNSIVTKEVDGGNSLIVSFPKLEKYEVSANNKTYKQAYGVRLFNEGKIEAIDSDEIFRNSKGVRYRKLNFKDLEGSQFVLVYNRELSSENLKGAECFYKYGAHSKYTNWIDGKSISTRLRSNNVNEIILEGGEKIMADGKAYSSSRLPITETDFPIKLRRKFTIAGKYDPSRFEVENIVIYGLELGIHKFKMTGSGDILYNTDGLALLNIVGEHEWVVV